MYGNHSKTTGAKEARNEPKDLEGAGYSSASYSPGYPIDKSLKEASTEDLKRGFQKGY